MEKVLKQKRSFRSHTTKTFESPEESLIVLLQALFKQVSHVASVT